jgi:hypothetical protein
LSNPDDLNRFCAFLRIARCVASPSPDGTVRVNIPDALTRPHEEHEVVGYVKTWNALNPGSHVRVHLRTTPL